MVANPPSPLHRPLARRSMLLLSLAALLAGCAPAEPSVPLIDPQARGAALTINAASVPTVALVMKTLTNPFFVEMEKGARRAAADLGVDLVVKAAAQETSLDQQIAILEGLVADQVDAIVVAPGDSTSLIPVLKKAHDQGIVIINIDNRLDPTVLRQVGMAHVPFISVDNQEGAYHAARAISADIVRPTQAVIIEGILTAQNARDRSEGARRAFAENPQIRLVASQTAHWKIDEAYGVTRQLFSRYPEIGLIFCANDMMALGAIQYLRDTGRHQVRVAGFDALDEATAAVRAGSLGATVNQQAARQGYLGISYAAQALGGQPVPAETFVPAILITSATLSRPGALPAAQAQPEPSR